jgi:hypothetical protein
MKNTPILSAFICTIILGITHSASAEKIKVKKVKGNSAVIESTTPLEEGQTYEIGPEAVAGEVDYKGAAMKSRTNSLSFGANFEYLKSDLSQSNIFGIQGRYGWNFSNLEVGLMAELESVDVGAGATSTFLVGGYFDYNMVSNRDPRDLIYGPFVLLATGSTQYPASATGGSSTKLASNVGGFLTYFLGGSSTAIRGEGFYNYQQINTTAGQNAVAGFGARLLLVYYF